jgi:hypothetical protein
LTVLNELPLEYQRTFRLVRELEDQQQGAFVSSSWPNIVLTASLISVAHTTELQSSLEALVASTLNPSSAPSPAPSTSTADEPPQPSPSMRARLNKLSSLATAAVRAGEDKIGLAITLYEAVSAVSTLAPLELTRFPAK